MTSSAARLGIMIGCAVAFAVGGAALAVPPEAVAVTGAASSSTKPRAAASGTYVILRSGRRRVSVKSNAKKVRLTYRTATNNRRSTMLAIRKGAWTKILSRGSKSISVRALATSRLRASVRVRVRPNPWRSDADGNGTLDYWYDADSDGHYEMVLFDDDRNGRFEAIFLDAGTTSGLFKDQDQDGYYEVVALDMDRDGRAERLFYDGDRDGYPELQCLDLVGNDGVADTWVDTRVSSGNLRQDRAASDLMVRSIVTLNQLRQLDPWSTGYIPYNPAPSLL